MTADETGIINANGAQLYYKASGDGEALVLIHAFSLDHRMWNPQVESFSRHMRVIRYDMRGFGRSSAPQDGVSYAHAEDLAALLAQMGVESVHLCGLSLGGGVALDFALRYPGSTRSLTLVDSVLDGFEWSERQRALDGDVWRTGREISIDAARARWKSHPLFVPLMEHPEAWTLFETMVDSYSGWHWQHRNPVAWVDPDAIDRLTELRIPTLVVAGERDLPDFLEVSNILTWGIHKARQVTLSGVGHLANMEAPEEFNRALITFLVGRATR